jgi:hypothetical protein
MSDIEDNGEDIDVIGVDTDVGIKFATSEGTAIAEFTALLTKDDPPL